MPRYDIGAAVYNATLPTVATGQRVDLQCDSSGRVIPADVNLAATIFASTPRTATANSTDQTNTYHKGVCLYLDLTAGTAGVGGATLNIKVQGKDPISGNYVDIPGASFPQFTEASDPATDELVIYPGIAETANETVSDILPTTWRVVATIAGDTPSFTFSLGSHLIR